MSAKSTAIFAGNQRMGFPHFIARRIIGDKDRDDRLSRPIVVIAVLGVVIGMAVMILTVGISTGFQREVRAKVTGAGAHIEIVPIMQAGQNASIRVPIDQPFHPWLDTVPGVRHIQPFAILPGIVETPEEIQGVVVKGIGDTYDLHFLRAHMESGGTLSTVDSVRNEALISRWMADRLRQGVGDTITIYLVRGDDEVRPRKYLIKGIYRTGLEKVDHELVYVDLRHLQRFAQWGIKAEIEVEGPDVEGRARVKGLAFGGQGPVVMTWPGLGLEGPGPFTFPFEGVRGRRLTMVATDVSRTVPDTTWVVVQGIAADGTAIVQRGGSGGSHGRYAGGFEVLLDRTEDLDAMDDLIYREHLTEQLRTVTARERFPEIFAWLELLDTNVVVVIVLMVVVAIINMTSALLIIIIERTPMIGVLKALGTSNGTIRRIFLIDAAYILGVGILLGDMLGIGLALVQRHFGLVRLPVESYYVDHVPVDLSLPHIALLNVGVLLICVAAMVLPSLLVTRIAPARAIKFD